MDIKFDEAGFDVFSKLNKAHFQVNNSIHKIFVCGGAVNANKIPPESFRHRFIEYLDIDEDELKNSIVLAENFKDYFKENAYPDLLMFEDEMASLASLVMIFLESPGSLVELGMFCSKPNFYDKLLIIASREETQQENSFIYLGPIKSIAKKVPTAIEIYPWPDPSQITYDKNHLIDLQSAVKSKINSIPKRVQFDEKISGHVATLITEIVRLCYPLLFNELEMFLVALNIEKTQSEIHRSLYLLIQLGFIETCTYSRYKYYYPIKKDISLIRFGKTNDNQPFDIPKLKMSLAQTYILDEADTSRKRKAARNEINDILNRDQI